MEEEGEGGSRGGFKGGRNWSPEINGFSKKWRILRRVGEKSGINKYIF